MINSFNNKNIIKYLTFILVIQGLFCSQNLINSFGLKAESIQYGGTLIDSSVCDAQIINPILTNDYTSNKIANLISQMNRKPKIKYLESSETTRQTQEANL